MSVKSFSTLCLLCVTTLAFAQDAYQADDFLNADEHTFEIPAPISITGKTFGYFELDVPPVYPGGMNAFVAYLNAIPFPEEAREEIAEGKVRASFIINPDGTISKVQLREGLHPACDEAVTAALERMQVWTPGKKKGGTVATLINVSVAFEMTR